MLESLSSPPCELELWEGSLLRWVNEVNRSVPAFSLWKTLWRLSHANQLAQVCPGNQLHRNNLKRLISRQWYSLYSGKGEHFEQPKSGSFFYSPFSLCVGSCSSWGSTLLPRGWRRNSTRTCGHRDTWQWSMSDQMHPTNGIPKPSFRSPLYSERWNILISSFSKQNFPTIWLACGLTPWRCVKYWEISYTVSINP